MAACALAFMTSPSLPVRVSLPLPGTTVTSAVSRSPPNIVTASPLARPISSSFSRRISRNFSTPSQCGRRSAGDLKPGGPRGALEAGGAPPAGEPLLGDLAAHRGDLALEVPDARLLGVAMDDRGEA